MLGKRKGPQDWSSKVFDTCPIRGQSICSALHSTTERWLLESGTGTCEMPYIMVLQSQYRLGTRSKPDSMARSLAEWDGSGESRNQAKVSARRPSP